jgi:hypothetical protein
VALRLDSSIEKDILIWEMENSKEEDRLFICRIRKTLQKYNLPSPEEILERQRMYSRFSVELLGTFLILHAVQVLVRHILFACLYSISLQYLFSHFLGKLFQGA